MNKIGAIIFFTTLLMFLSFIVSFAGFPIGLLGSGELKGIQESPFEKGVCEIGGWDAPIDLYHCSAENLKYFTQFLFVDSPYKFIAWLVFLPFTVVMIYLIIKALPTT